MKTSALFVKIPSRNIRTMLPLIHENPHLAEGPMLEFKFN
jgi:hypothetical protein